ncbi:hypothetical protein GGQ80_001429 [Sphingomonas jinjuensis]|uniref:Uncharacterized protein n=1 Tax=Sphingomonas jinjuensis TaxID=535907 RepID=A0A840FD95_9SPHN|nr:hypothetical protein [Sphingomonas jinjuensis]MBB4153527.1 hypothetical protein [Sphingomonas jinjuensis]
MSGRQSDDATSRQALLAIMAQAKVDRANADAHALRGKVCPIQRPGLKR